MVIGEERILLLIEWYDSSHTHGWTSKEPPDSALVCRSVGWFIHLSDNSITIAPHVTRENPPQRNGEMTIPLAAVISKHRLDTSSKVQV